MEIGARVQPFAEADLTLPAFFVTRGNERVIRLNDTILDSPLAPVAIVHECSHHLLGHQHGACTPKIETRRERDVWLASALVAVSADLTQLVQRGHATVNEIAARCRVPEALVMIRLGMAVLLDSRQQRQLGQALDTIGHWLGRLELWIESVKRQVAVLAKPA